MRQLSALHPWPFSSRHHRRGKLKYSTSFVLDACLTECQGLIPQQTELSLTFKWEDLKDLQDTRYSRTIEVNLTWTAWSVSSINDLRLCTLAWTKLQRPSSEKGGGGVRGGGTRLCRLRFTSDFTVHALPITDKGETVLHNMWFHLEQVKQCRKVDPSSVAFQRSVRKNSKSQLHLIQTERG